MVTPARFERAAPRLGIWCSIRLSYGVPNGAIAASACGAISARMAARPTGRPQRAQLCCASSEDRVAEAMRETSASSEDRVAEAMRETSIEFVGRRHGKWQRCHRHALINQRLGFGKARLSVDRRFVALAIMHLAGFLGELVAHPGAVLEASACALASALSAFCTSGGMGVLAIGRVSGSSTSCRALPLAGTAGAIGALLTSDVPQAGQASSLRAR